MKRSLFIAIDIGGTKIAGALVTYSGKIISRRKIPTPQNASAKGVENKIRQMFDSLMEENETVKHRIRGAGICIPGLVSPDHKKIIKTPNIKLSEYPLVRNLEKDYKIPLFLDNDVNLGVLGEQWKGAGRKVKNLIGIFPGTGIGGGIILNGKMFTGAQGAAAEMGHMIMDLSSQESSAGQKGTLEALASRRAIERDIRRLIKSGKKSVVTQLNKGRLTVIRSKVLKEGLKKKDPVVKEVIDRVCVVLGKACINLRHIFNPEMIIFGGGVIEACGDYMLPAIRKVSDADPFFKKIDQCQIVPSALGDDANLLGATALVRKQMKPDLLRKPNYPKITLERGGLIKIEGKKVSGNVLLRADGKIKKIPEEKLVTLDGRSRHLSKEMLIKLCRKRPDVFVVGTDDAAFTLDSSSKAYIKKANLSFSRLAIPSAVKKFNSLGERKAMLIRQK